MAPVRVEGSRGGTRDSRGGTGKTYIFLMSDKIYYDLHDPNETVI